MNKKLHYCERWYESGGYGGAIHYCKEEKDGYFWVGNGEYSNQVDYCPFCGKKATALPKKDE